MAELTDRTLQRKWLGKDEWLSDRGSRGAGRLVAKLTASGDLTQGIYPEMQKQDSNRHQANSAEKPRQNSIFKNPRPV